MENISKILNLMLCLETINFALNYLMCFLKFVHGVTKILINVYRRTIVEKHLHLQCHL